VVLAFRVVYVIYSEYAPHSMVSRETCIQNTILHIANSEVVVTTMCGILL